MGLREWWKDRGARQLETERDSANRTEAWRRLLSSSYHSPRGEKIREKRWEHRDRSFDYRIKRERKRSRGM